MMDETSVAGAKLLQHEALTLAAALAFYTVLSLAPLVVFLVVADLGHAVLWRGDHTRACDSTGRSNSPRGERGVGSAAAFVTNVITPVQLL
jgi:hypothetical protein